MRVKVAEMTPLAKDGAGGLHRRSASKSDEDVASTQTRRPRRVSSPRARQPSQKRRGRRFYVDAASPPRFFCKGVLGAWDWRLSGEAESAILRARPPMFSPVFFRLPNIVNPAASDMMMV